jgi:hypothetical protein
MSLPDMSLPDADRSRSFAGLSPMIPGM